MADRRAQRARPAPRRSQHFLKAATAAELANAAGINARELVVEIGAGSGRLTAELARRAGHVIAAELDHAFAAKLRGRWDNVTIVEGDATGLVLPSEPFRVVANLPFHRTNDFLRLLFDDPRVPLTRADLVVEWGVAVKRALPWPSSASSVIWNATYECLLARRLPPTAFEPAPSVGAGVIVFRRREPPLLPVEAIPAFARFVASGFRHGLRGTASTHVLDRVGARHATARDLDAYQWAALYRFTSIRGRRRHG